MSYVKTFLTAWGQDLAAIPVADNFLPINIAWMGIDWDIRTRMPLIVEISNPDIANIIRNLPPITNASSLAATQNTLSSIKNKIANLTAKKTKSLYVASGDGYSNLGIDGYVRMAVKHAICTSAWAAAKGSGHGAAWKAAATMDSTIVPGEVLIVAQFAASYAAWIAGGNAAIIAAKAGKDPLLACQAAVTAAFAPNVALANNTTSQYISPYIIR